MASNSLPSQTNENCSFFPKTHLVTSRDSTLYCLIARTVPHSFPGLKPVSIAVDHSQTMSSSQRLERIRQTWPQVMEKGQSKKLVAWKPVLLALQIPTLPSFSFLMFLEARSKVAAAGFFVVVTDFLFGDPVDLSKPDFDSHGHEDAKLVIAALRSKGMNSIGAAGSCWGVSEVKIPVAFLGAEIDRASPPEQLKEYLQNLSHGWTVRYNVEDETAAGSAEEPHGDMIHWFTSERTYNSYMDVHGSPPSYMDVHGMIIPVVLENDHMLLVNSK
ncbi:hypothetical protein Peur_026308 [Populus x canadensis]